MTGFFAPSLVETLAETPRFPAWVSAAIAAQRLSTTVAFTKIIHYQCQYWVPLITILKNSPSPRCYGIHIQCRKDSGGVRRGESVLTERLEPSNVRSSRRLGKWMNAHTLSRHRVGVFRQSQFAIPYETLHIWIHGRIPQIFSNPWVDNLNPWAHFSRYFRRPNHINETFQRFSNL